MKILFALIIIISFSTLQAQFPPPAGQAGTTAIHKDSSIFVAWATNCTVVRGPQDISNPSLGLATAGEDWMATGKAGTQGTVSFGDGGYAIVTFEHPITNGPGWDFAIFENAFNDVFLELAFVEVSSDGINYFRFPATSLTQDSVQVDGFGSLDATKIDNLAGKYRVNYGTPFNLEELKGEAGLDVDAITHIKIIDVVGSILNDYATYDSHGNIINDPWPTPFPSSGFDLDAVGVINSLNAGIKDVNNKYKFTIFPNPAQHFFKVSFNDADVKKYDIIFNDVTGRTVLQKRVMPNNTIDVSNLSPGLYFLNITTKNHTATRSLVITK